MVRSFSQARSSFHRGRKSYSYKKIGNKEKAETRFGRYLIPEKNVSAPSVVAASVFCELTGGTAGSSRRVYSDLGPAGDSGRRGGRVGLRRRTGVSVVAAAPGGGLLDTGGLLSHVGLIVLGQMGLLTEALAAERAGERLLAGVRPDVHVHAVLVLEALAADAAIVQGPFLALNTTGRPAGAAGLLLTRVAGLRTGAAVAGAVGIAAVAIGASDIFLRRLGGNAHPAGSQLQLTRLLLLLLIHVGSLSGLLLLLLQNVLLSSRDYRHGAHLAQISR